MEVKFTKGDWFVDADMTIMTNDSTADDDMICDMMPVEINEAVIANAHLIAAAPEMYKWLQVVIDSGEIDSLATHNTIVGLLAKARGES